MRGAVSVFADLLLGFRGAVWVVVVADLLLGFKT